MIRFEISIKRNGYVCTVYDDKKHVELGICDYTVAREVLEESLKDNIRQQFGLSQVTLHKLNLASSNVKSETSPETLITNINLLKFNILMLTVHEKKQCNCNVN